MLRFLPFPAVMFVSGIVAGAQVPQSAAPPPANPQEQVRLFANGREVLRVGSLPIDVKLVIHTDLFEMTRVTAGKSQNAGLAVRLEGADSLWVTPIEYGDYTFVGGSVSTDPTYIDVLRLDKDHAVIQWGFGAHVIDPSQYKFARDWPGQAYPFRKTIWVQRGVQGYYVLVEPLVDLPAFMQQSDGIEHEIGFGGVWGAGTITTLTDTLRTSSLDGQRYVNQSQVRNVGLLDRDGDPLLRYLVPMPPEKMVSTFFSKKHFGGLWILSHHSGPFGAFISWDLRGTRRSLETVCREAWLHAPSELLSRIQYVGMDTCEP